MSAQPPVFYDCEASDVEGYPIEIGWAFTDLAAGAVVSESHLIQPADGWQVRESWDRAAERLHRITLQQLRREGRPVEEVARRMNDALRSRDVFSDAHEDKVWLRLLFQAAGIAPAFIVRETDARALIAQAAAAQGLDEAAYAKARALAAELAPRHHRAEADARHLAVLWNIVIAGRVPP